MKASGWTKTSNLVVPPPRDIPIPTLRHGLRSVLFNKGIHSLRALASLSGASSPANRQQGFQFFGYYLVWNVESACINFLDGADS